MAKRCGAGRVLTVYLPADEFDAGIVDRAMEVLGTRNTSATVREALRFVVREAERNEDLLAGIHDIVRRNAATLEKIQRSVGAAFFGGRKKSA